MSSILQRMAVSSSPGSGLVDTLEYDRLHLVKLRASAESLNVIPSERR